jgi:N-acetyl-alpha-D-muramate 1-phosphate uridylyltransferase
MHAMILAAGRGERMRPLTDSTPKPLLQVAGKPLLQWHLEAFAQAGFESVVINVAYLGSQIEQFVGDGSRWGLRVRFSKEPEGALETAGGIAQARPWVKDLAEPCMADRFESRGNASVEKKKTCIDETGNSPFLVINADIWTDWPRAQAFAIASEMRATDSLAHIVLVDNPPHHLQGDFEFDGAVIASPKGVAIHPEAQSVTASSPQASVAVHSLTFSGIGIYRPGLFSDIQPGQRAALAPLLRQAMAAGQCTASHYRGKWSDIGTPERLNDMHAALSEPKSLSEPK